MFGYRAKCDSITRIIIKPALRRTGVGSRMNPWNPAVGKSISPHSPVHPEAPGLECGRRAALWRKDGKELFYLGLDGKLMAVDMKAGLTIETGAPRVLFQTRIQTVPGNSQYCTTHDGQRFLLADPVERTVITVVVNGTAGLKR